MPLRAALALLAILLPLTSNAQDKCTVQGQAEQDRIVREFSGRPPARGDKDAERAWARDLHAALAAAVGRAEDCSRANRPPVTPAAAAKEQECIAESNRRAEEFQKRYGGRTLTAQEHATRRTEETRLIDERLSCSNRMRR